MPLEEKAWWPDGVDRPVGTVEELPLSSLLRDYAPAYFSTWEEWFAKAPQEEGARLRPLREDLARRGQETPVVLSPAQLVQDDEGGWVKLPATLADGMHRLAILQEGGGDPLVKVVYGREESSPDVSELLFLHLVWDPAALQEALSFDPIEEVYPLLSWRSSAAASSPWITIEMGSSYENHLEVMLAAFPQEAEPLLDLEVLAREAEERLSPLPLQVNGVLRARMNREGLYVDQEGTPYEEQEDALLFPSYWRPYA